MPQSLGPADRLRLRGVPLPPTDTHPQLVTDLLRHDHVFKALADPTRRLLLDRLLARDGGTLTGLRSDTHMTRFGVMKHLRVLEHAGLVTTRRSGREKLHFLNTWPIRLIQEQWIEKYTARPVSPFAGPESAGRAPQRPDA
jgi:DNA-binding transcriptional ArsR family regulator